MKRTRYIDLCLWITLAAVLTAAGMKYGRNPGPPGRDSLSMLAPIFFVIAAKRASHSRASGPIATIGLVFGLAAFAAVFGGGG